MTKRYYPKTPDTTIKVGDPVRSYDFVGDVDNYICGKVVEMDVLMSVT